MPRVVSTSSLNDYPKLSISQYKQHNDEATLDYSYRGKDYRYKVAVTKTACHYGGYRYWWLCPNCSKRVGVLYCAGVYVCRHCIGALYRTQLMQPIDKLFRRVEKIRHKLGWQAGIAHGHGNRPKGMHRKTYDRLVWEHDKIADLILGNELDWISKLTNTCNRGKP